MLIGVGWFFRTSSVNREGRSANPKVVILLVASVASMAILAHAMPLLADRQQRTVSLLLTLEQQQLYSTIDRWWAGLVTALFALCVLSICRRFGHSERR